jgi:hypothetical protein
MPNSKCERSNDNGLFEYDVIGNKYSFVHRLIVSSRNNLGYVIKIGNNKIKKEIQQIIPKIDAEFIEKYCDLVCVMIVYLMFETSVDD